MDGLPEMTLNSTGLGILTLPSSNLHVNGNAIISEQLFVGGSSGSSNLNVNGTIGYGFQTVSANSTLGDSSVVLVDSSSDNIILTLPYAGNVSGRIYNIKKTSLLNSVWISGAGNLIDDTSPIELANSTTTLPSVKVMSNGSQWYVIESKDLSATVASDNLVGWWKMDEASNAGNVVSDSSQANNHGVVNNIASGNIGVTGKFNRALDFDGVNDSVTVPDDSSIGDGVQTGLTVSSWFNSAVSLNTTAVTNRILEKGDSYFLLQGNGGGGVGTGGMNFLVKRLNSNYVAEINQSLNANQWYHIVGTFDGSDIKVYLDGVLKDTTNVGGPIDDDNLPLRIGSDDGGTYINAHIDDLRIYNRALTSSEIQALYNQGQ